MVKEEHFHNGHSLKHLCIKNSYSIEFRIKNPRGYFLFG